ncbi:unnamed protein product, partial [Amoebophrya sp. A120]
PTLIRQVPNQVYLENDEIWGTVIKTKLQAKRYAGLMLTDLWTMSGIDARSDAQVALDFLAQVFG